MANYGSPFRLGNEPKPGSILLRLNELQDGFIGFVSDFTANTNSRLCVFIGKSNGVVYASAMSGIAWNVTDFMDVVPDVNSAKATHSHLAHGTLFLGESGEMGIYGTNGSPRESIAFDIHSGKICPVPSERIVFERWRLIARDSDGNEVGEIDPQVVFA